MNTPISPSATQNTRVRTVFSHLDTRPFSHMELDTEVNVPDLQRWVAEDQLVALVDEAEGGIIGYVNRAHADRIAGLLNAAASESIDAAECLGVLLQTAADDGLLDKLTTPEFRARCEAITGPIKRTLYR